MSGGSQVVGLCVCSDKALVTPALSRSDNRYWSDGIMAHHPDGKYIVDPDGIRSTAANLPSITTKRWVIRRKAQVVNAVHKGVLSLEEACRRYLLTADEFAAWERAIDEHGLAGLRTTRLQHYRGGRERLHPFDRRHS